MIGDFWNAAGGKLADRWAAASAPALVFWVGGLLAWIYGHGGLDELTTVTDWLNEQSSPVQVAAIITVLLGVTASAILVERITTPTLRLLEGYWPSWLGRLWRYLVDRVKKRAEAEDESWQQLMARTEPADQLTADDRAALGRLEAARRRRPNAPTSYMPTRIGNVLRAAESWPADKYGLDAVAVWPRLWLVLPDATRQELTAARASLDSAVTAGIWGLLFCGFAPWTGLVVPVGLGIAVAAIKLWVPARAELYGDLIEAAYDIHRTALYEALRWPLPANPQAELRQGKLLTSYLWRGSDSRTPQFSPPARDER